MITMEILRDGTPIEDVLAHNRELAAQISDLKRRMREIKHMCQAPNFTATARRNAILEIVNRPPNSQ